ncbi:MAG: hypothetical protein H5T69_11800 [Chloroflexi bacterium]|nr:hypothetical protein [Chloroflexota bacterium]
MRDALRQHYLFNVLESSSEAKVALGPLPEETFTRMALERRQRLAYDQEGHTAVFIGEDLVLAKLLAYRATGSDEHLRDARGVLTVQ